MNKPLVSILMNCYNSATYLREAIESVYAQSYDNWEIIFWDNASTDSSAEIANSYDSKLKYFYGETNIPLYAARNEAIKKAEGELIAFLDCDDLWLPEKLEKQIKVFGDERIGASFHDVVYFNEKDGDLRQLYKTRPFYEGECFRDLLSDYYISILTVMVRKSTLEKLAYVFDTRFQMIGDADLLRRIALDWQLAYVDAALGKWREHAESLSHKVPEKFAEETELLLDTYEKDIPSFEEIYGKEISILRSQNAYIRAKASWRRGDGSAARAELKGSLVTKRNYMLYGLSFFPEGLVRKIRDNVYRKAIRRF
jgi:glycosyltransferase involved in cell wall biosynthesis